VSFRLKTILGIALIEAILLLILISMTLDYLKSTNYDALVKRASTTATLFATTTKDGVLSYDLASLEAFVSEVMKNPDLKYARVLGPQGQLFARGGDQNALNRSFVADIKVQDVTDGIYDTFAHISEAGVIYGRVELGLDIAPIIETINEAKQRSAFIGLIEMGLVALFSLLLGSYLTSQLKILTKAAKSISRGDLNVVVPIKGRDEIADVARSFNSMAQSLRIASERRDRADEELKEFNQSLESRVVRRTAQLQARNQQLIEANQAIKTAQTQLLQSEKMASLGLLAAGIAHEVNNPMSFVISNMGTLREYSECYQWLLKHYRLLLAETDNDKKAQIINEITDKENEFDMAFIEGDIDDLLKDTLDGSMRVKEIVSGLKEFSHLDKSDNYDYHDLNQCIESTLKMVNNELKYRCEVKTDLHPLPHTLLEVGKINQVIMNLLINASQAIQGKGCICISSQVLGKKIIVKVEDDGQGIEPLKLSSIFDPFYSTKEVGVGTGLGLSISYSIIEEHGGSINVQSEVNVGTCFTIELPIATNKSDFRLNG